MQAGVEQHVLVFLDGEHLAAVRDRRVVARPDALAALLRRTRVEERAAVHAAHGNARTSLDEEIGVESLRELERHVARVLRREAEGELHRHGHRQLQIEVMRPHGARLVGRRQSKADLREVLGIVRAAHMPRGVAREAVRLRALAAAAREPRPADGNAAVDFLPRRRFVVRMRHVEDRQVSRGAVRERLRAEERHLGRAVPVREHHDRHAVARRTEHDPLRRAIAPVQFHAIRVSRQFSTVHSLPSFFVRCYSTKSSDRFQLPQCTRCKTGVRA